MACADQNPAIAGFEREDVAGRASIETVKLVSWREELRGAIKGRSSASIRFPAMARQIRPFPWEAMKLIASGVAIWAGMIRSPSFSRSSWSTTKLVYAAIFRQACDVAGERVDLQIDPIALFCVAPIGHGFCVRDQIDAELIAIDLVDGQRGAIEHDRAFGGDKPGQIAGSFKGDAGAVALPPRLVLDRVSAE